MKTLDEIKKHRQVSLVLGKAVKYEGNPVTEADSEVVKVTVTPRAKDDIGTFMAAGRSWAPDADIVKGDKNQVIFTWKRALIEGPAEPGKKPDGAVADADVLKLIPRGQIDSKALLVSVLIDLRKSIELAYPGQALSEAGLGLGKKNLVLKIIETLLSEGRISRNVAGASTVVIQNLIYHLQIQLGATMILDEPLPVVRQSSPDTRA